MAARIVVTRRIPEPALELLEQAGDVWVSPHDRPLTTAELHSALGGADAAVTLLHDRVDAAFLDAAGPGLRVVANVAVGYDNVDVAACAARGVVVHQHPRGAHRRHRRPRLRPDPGLHAAAGRGRAHGARRRHVVVEHVLHAGDRACRERRSGSSASARSARATARRARAFGMRIAYTGRRQADAELEAELEATRLDLDELLATADVVSIHCPLSDATRHLIDARRLGLMKPTAYLINCARGPIVAEAALAQALRDGTIAGAGLDVFEHEPAIEPELLELENVVLLPHLGSATIETRTAMGVLAARNAVAVLAGQAPLTPDAACKSGDCPHQPGTVPGPRADRRCGVNTRCQARNIHGRASGVRRSRAAAIAAMCAGRAAAASADQLDAERAHPAGVVGHLGGGGVVVELVAMDDGQAGVRLGEQEQPLGPVRDHLLHHRLHVVDAAAAVGADTGHAHLGERLHRLGRRDAHHRVPVGVEAERDDHLEIGRHLMGCAHDRLGLGQVAHRLGQDQVGARARERLDLLGERRLGVLRRQRPQRLDQLAGRADVARDQHAELVRHAARDPDRGGVDVGDPIAETGHGQAWRRGAEGVGGDEHRARGRVVAVDRGDRLGPLQIPALTRFAGLEARALQHRPHRPVEKGTAPGRDQFAQARAFGRRHRRGCYLPACPARPARLPA